MDWITGRSGSDKGCFFHQIFPTDCDRTQRHLQWEMPCVSSRVKYPGREMIDHLNAEFIGSYYTAALPDWSLFHGTCLRTTTVIIVCFENKHQIAL